MNDAATSARASLDVAHWNTLQLFEDVPAAEPVAAPCKEGASAAAAAAVAVRGRSMVAASPVPEQRPLHSSEGEDRQPRAAAQAALLGLKVVLLRVRLRVGRAGRGNRGGRATSRPINLYV